MNYLRWYRKVLNLPVVNEVKMKLIEPAGEDVYRLHIEGAGASSNTLLARKVILATGIQGGGEWHVPSMISEILHPSSINNYMTVVLQKALIGAFFISRNFLNIMEYCH